MRMPRLAVALSSLLGAVALAACGCGPKKSAEPIPTGGGPGTDTGSGPTADDVGAVDLSKLGTPCGDGDRCDGGTRCVTYYGVAGPRGPEFKSCEIACPSGKGPCPAGTACITIADGPGSVCRANAPVEPVPPTPTVQ